MRRQSAKSACLWDGFREKGFTKKPLGERFARETNNSNWLVMLRRKTGSCQYLKIIFILHLFYNTTFVFFLWKVLCANKEPGMHLLQETKVAKRGDTKTTKWRKKVTWRRDQNHDTLIVINGVFFILTTNQGFSLLCSQRRLQTDQTDQVNLETSRGTTTRGDKNIIESLSPLCSATTLFSMSDKSNREFMINPLSEALVLTTLLINWQKAKKRLSRFCEQVKQSVWG